MDRNILNLWQVELLTGIIFFNGCAIFMANYKIFKLTTRKTECENYLLKTENEPDTDNEIYFKEVFDSQNNFKYTEVIVPVISQYRNFFEKHELNIEKA